MVLKQKKKAKPAKKENSPEKDAPKASETKKSSKDGSPEKIEELTNLLEEEKDRVLRLSADFENYKKRKEKEIDGFKKFANESVFKQLLTVVDNLERAISSVEEASDESHLLEGVKLTHKEILKLFKTFDVVPVEAKDQPFNPTFHQAVTQEESHEVPDNTVISVLQKGYLLHDRLIRPAMVVVSKRVEKETEKEIEQSKEN